MEKVANGSQRRKNIIQMLKQTTVPVSGTKLGKENGVSRQVIVQDITLLRVEGHDIVATPRGYVLNVPQYAKRVFKIYHLPEQTEEELTTIVDLGGFVLDTIVNHRVYGKVTVPLNIRNRRDIQIFMDQLKTGKSKPISNVTSGYHFHTVAAGQEEILDEIEAVLQQKGMLTEVLPYEKELTEIC